MKVDKLHFAQTEVKTALKNLPLEKAKGPDGLGNLPPKRVARYLSVSLKLVFNTIANKHRFPVEWKTSNIIPLYENGDKQRISNYCLISLLACVSKVLQYPIFDKLCSAIESVIHPEQHGFRNQKSTVTLMILYLSTLFGNPNAGTLATIYWDFEKTFDKVCHGKLTEKLHNYGVMGEALELIENYLQGRNKEYK